MRTTRAMYVGLIVVLAASAAPAAAAGPPPPAPEHTTPILVEYAQQLATGRFSAELHRLGIHLYQEHTMAESIREGGVYRVGSKYLNAEGKETKAPTKAELEKANARRTASTTVVSEPLPPEFNEDFPSFKVLSAAGIDSLEKVRAATDAELIALDGIGEASVKKIREAQGE